MEKKSLPKAVYICILLLFAYNGLFAAEIKGIVKDIYKKPLPNVRVIARNSGATAETDGTGAFRFDPGVKEGQTSVVLVFERNGYHPREKCVLIDGKLKIFKLFFIPMETIQHSISVTAMHREEKTASAPVAENTVSDLEIQEKMSENIVETLSDIPGVHFIGKGGHTVTPSIRGLSRRRVLLMVDGARVTSDRRVGASASFLPPEIIRRIEVVRSSSSVFYGSDAMGGVVNVLTRDFVETDAFNDKNVINFNVNSANKRINTGINLEKNFGKFHIASAFQYTRARDYSSPGQKILHSGYTNYAGIFDLSYKGDKRDFFLGYIGGMGVDVGRPDRENLARKYSVVPHNDSHFIRFGYRQKDIIKNGALHVSLFLNPGRYVLDKINLDKETRDRSNTEGTNLGIKTFVEKCFNPDFSLQTGVEWYSRSNTRITNKARTAYEEQVTHPMANGKRNDYGLFLTLRYSGIRNIDINGGIRHTFFSTSAEADGIPLEKSDDATSFFIGITRRFGEKISLFCNIGRAFRFPSLSESYYTGITGRKYVVGNPLLQPESSFNLDTGVKISSGRNFLGLYLFSYRVDRLIERYRNEENIYTYDNIHRGDIYGGEIEARFFPLNNVELFGHYFYYRGRSDIDDQPLNDLPASRIFLGGKLFFDRFRITVDYMHSFKNDDPGPAEVENAAYDVFNMKGVYYLSSSVFVYLKVSNIFNRLYYANPDPDIPEARGTDLSAGLQFYF